MAALISPVQPLRFRPDAAEPAIPINGAQALDNHANKTLPFAPTDGAQLPMQAGSTQWMPQNPGAIDTPLVLDDADPCQRHIDQPAHPPAFWQARMGGESDAEPTAERSAAHWLDNHGRLVVVAPHPDDEVLMCSGLMLQQLRRGGEVLVMGLTDGEACFGADVDRAAIALQRRGEALAGLHALGAAAAEVMYFGLPDGVLALHERAVEQRLLDLLRPTDLVVCTWRSDGHPDHEAAGRATAWACAERSVTLLEAPVWMWHWARVAHPAIAWQHLVRMPLCQAELDRKWDALQCHASQLRGRDGALPVVDAALQARVRWPFETFFEASGSA